MTSPTPTFTIGAIAPSEWNISGMQFDAWLKLNHNTSTTFTQHPVETGSKASDHSYDNQARFSFDILMSDTINTSLVFGLFSNPFAQGKGRSINAYTALEKMRKTRQLLTLDSKYGFYSDVLIESIDVTDDYTTKNSLRATINIVQLFLVDTKLSKVSINPNATMTTNRGKVAPVKSRLGTKERFIEDWQTTEKAIKRFRDSL